MTRARNWVMVVGGLAAAAAGGVYLALPSDPPPADGPAVPDPRETKLAAVRAAMQPGGNPAAAVPLLDDPDPEVRSAALLAVGPPRAGPPVVGDEELFRFLNDPDVGVRKLCTSALTARGRSAEEIAFGRKLVHPDPRERLSLLADLRYADDAVKDVGPWLERLARDPDPAVRAGAARVAAECRAGGPWLDALAENDPDPTVRRVAGYYRREAGGVTQTGFGGR